MRHTEKNIYSVYQVNSYIKYLMEEDLVLNCISVTGEISNYKNHPSGHLYFTLKDGYAAIKCVMFKFAARGLDFVPENGQRVIIEGRVSVYEKTGDYQLYADYMKKAGTGVLFENFEILKRKLMDEGLFDEERKRKIPSYVKCVAVVTSKSGAAVRDIVQIIKRRNKSIKIVVAPVQVQGESAALQISKAIEYVNAWGRADCMIVGRGGGSYEDLQAFNEEIVARSIANSKIPVISAVGHETDFTISDFVADLRAPTPSAAAELVSFNLDETRDRIKRNLFKINRAVNKRLEYQSDKLLYLKNRRIFKNPAECIYERQIYVHSLYKRALSRVNGKISEAKTMINFNASAAHNLSPLKIISRGYALISSENGKIISRIDEMRRGKVKIIMRGGTAKAQVYDIEKSAGEPPLC